MYCQTKSGPNLVTNRTALRTYVLRLAAVALSVLSILCFALYAGQPVAAQDAALSPQAQQILDAVNQARTDNGLPALRLNPQLTLAAQRHVDDVVANGNWGHYGSDGSNVQMRAARVGYPTSSVSENWVAVSDPSQAIGWWMNDWIHRVNILEPHWDEVGVGAAQAGNGFWILVTDFGNIDGGALPPVDVAAPVTQLAAGGGNGDTEAIPANGEYTIAGGDTLMGIAIRFGLDWQDIALTNNMGENDLLQIGHVIRLPSRGGTGGPVESSSSVKAGKQSHVVRTGETLWTIAARYQVPWQDIAAVNDLGEADLLQIGQELKLPASLDEPEKPVDKSADQPAEKSKDKSADKTSDQTDPKSGDPASDKASSFAQNNAQNSQAAAGDTYTVKSGDTLLAIALSHDLDWHDLATANNLTEDSFLQIGDTLKLPKPQQLSAPTVPTDPDTATSDAAKVALGKSDSGNSDSAKSDSGKQDSGSSTGFSQATAQRIHHVQPGDTIYGIALQYGVDWNDLLKANDLSEDSILQPDQEIKIP